MITTDRLFVLDGDLVSGRIVDRPNRFVVTVRFGDDAERAYLADPGALEGLLVSGREILCSPVDNPNRSTEYDAIAVQMGDIYVSVRAVLANELFEAALTNGLVPRLDGYSVLEREPRLPDHGRTDFLLETPTRERAYVEVKSCTHVENRVAKFPDRQTERGRRHLRALESLLTQGFETAIVFVVQRPDAELFRPIRRSIQPLPNSSVGSTNLGLPFTPFPPPLIHRATGYTTGHSRSIYHDSPDFSHPNSPHSSTPESLHVVD